MKHKFIVYGWVNPELSVEIGTFETNLNLVECWDYISNIFSDNSVYVEGLYAKETK